VGAVLVANLYPAAGRKSSLDGNFVTSRTVMAGRFDKEFAYTPIGTVEPNGRRVRWELINIFRYTDEGRIAEEWVQTDTHEFLRQLGEV
jgi:predicted ester cyclase